MQRGSTLRLALGCHLSEALGIQLQRVGSGSRVTFTPQGRQSCLSGWLATLVWQSMARRSVDDRTKPHRGPSPATEHRPQHRTSQEPRTSRRAQGERTHPPDLDAKARVRPHRNRSRALHAARPALFGRSALITSSMCTGSPITSEPVAREGERTPGRLCIRRGCECGPER